MINYQVLYWYWI